MRQNVEERRKGIRESTRKWRENRTQAEKSVSRSREYYRAKENPSFRVLKAMRRRMRKALQSKSKSDLTLKLLGCSALELKAWLSGWFEPGMSWENYGQWHIDHNRPCSSFNLSNPLEQEKCFHYLNLRPLWAKDNLIKGARWV